MKQKGSFKQQKLQQSLQAKKENLKAFAKKNSRKLKDLTHMIPVPYKVMGDHQIPSPYKVWGTIRVPDHYKVPTVDSNHEDTAHWQLQGSHSGF